MSKEAEDAFDQIMEREGLAGKVREHPGNPSAVAAEFIEEWAGDRVCWRGDFYHWNGSFWEKEEWQELLADINRELMASVYWQARDNKDPVKMPWSPNNQSLANLERQLRLQAVRPANMEPARGGRFVYLKDGRYVPMTGRMLPHDKKDFNLYCSPIAFSDIEGAQCPEWDGLLKNAFDGDQDSIDTHYLWMAVELCHAVDLQKIYYLTGPKRTGKGVMMDVSSALIGENQVTGMSLGDFGGDFGMQALLGKNVCRINDSRGAGKNGHVAVERLLSITGGGRIQVNIKRMDPWVGRLDVLFTIDSNLEIDMPDASGAIGTRMIFNRTANSVLGHEDFGLGQRIIDNELPGVMRKVLEYVDRIHDDWPVNSRAEASRARSKAVSQPLSAWADDVSLLIGREHSAPVQDVYDSYSSWCMFNGDRPMHPTKFGTALAGFVDGLDKKKRGPRGEQVAMYLGVSLPGGAE